MSADCRYGQRNTQHEDPEDSAFGADGDDDDDAGAESESDLADLAVALVAAVEIGPEVGPEVGHEADVIKMRRAGRPVPELPRQEAE